MKKRVKRLLSIVLCLAMVLGVMPGAPSVHAEGNASTIVLTKTDGTIDDIIVTDGVPSKTSGDNWSYDVSSNILTLNGWSGQKITANGSLDLHLIGENTITMKDESGAKGIEISSTTKEAVNVTAAADGKLTVKSPDGGLTNSYQAVSFPNLSGQFAGTLNIKSGEIVINVASSSASGYGVAGDVKFENKESGTVKLTVSLSSTDATALSGYLTGLRNLDVSGVTGAEISVNVSAASKDVKAEAIYVLRATDSGAVVTTTAANSASDTPALNKQAIGYAYPISLAAGGKITANGCVVVDRSVLVGGFIDIVYGKTQTTTPANNKYLLVKGSDYYDPAVISDMAGQPLMHVVIEPATEVPTLTWLGGDITIPEGKVNQSIDAYSFYPYLRGISAYGNLSVKVTSGSLPAGLSCSKSSGIYGKPTTTCDAGSAVITFTDNMGTTDTADDRTVDITVNYGAVAEADKFITVGSTKFVTASNQSGSGWSWDAAAKKLTLTNYNGGPVKAEIGFDLHLIGENTITMKDESGAKGIGISSVKSEIINVTAATDGKLTVKSPDGGLTNSYEAVSFPNLSGQFAGTLNIKSGEVVIDITSSYGGTSSGNPIGCGVAGTVAFADKENSTAKLTVNLSSTTNAAGVLDGLNELNVSGVTGAEISVNVSAASKDVKAEAIYVLRATDSGAVVTATATNTVSDTPALNKQAIGSAYPISLATGGKITANGCVLVPYSVWNGNFIDVIYGKTKITTPANNSYLLVKESGVYPPAVMSDTTNKQPLTTVVIEPATEVPTLAWLGGDITIPEGIVNESIDAYYFYPYLRGISAYGNLSVKVTTGSLPAGLSCSKSSGIYGKPTEACDAGTATITFKDSMGTTDTADDRTVDITVNYGAVKWPNPVTGVNVSETSVTVNIGGTATVTGSVVPDNASYPNLSVISSNSAVATATVTDPNEAGQSTITITGKSVGIATITVKSMDNSGFTASVTVNVKEAAPNAHIDYSAEELSDLVASAKYLIDGAEYTADTNGRIAIDSDFFGKTLEIIKMGETAATNSDAQSLTVPARVAAPAGFKVTTVSKDGASDGKITDVDSTMEYSSDGVAWTSVSGTSIGNLKAATYYVRYKATATAFASHIATVSADLLNHDCSEHLTAVPAKAATCTETGNEAYYACSCGKLYKDEAAATQTTLADVTTPQVPHSYGEWQVRTAATCTAKGEEFRTCANCTAEETREIAMIPHDYADATCTAPKTCKHCPATEGEALGHDMATVWSTDADKHWHECSRCDHIEDEAPHTPGADATEDTPQTCTVCGYVIKAALGHVCTNNLTLTEKKEATHFEEGKEAYYTCTCGKHYADAAGTVEIADIAAWGIIPKTDHVASEWMSDENNHWHECTIEGCDAKTEPEAHRFGWVIDREATETEAGSKHEECSVCGYKKAAVEIPAAGAGAGQDTPKTGDNGMMLMWVALLFVSLGGAAGVTVLKRKGLARK